MDETTTKVPHMVSLSWGKLTDSNDHALSFPHPPPHQWGQSFDVQESLGDARGDPEVRGSEFSQLVRRHRDSWVGGEGKLQLSLPTARKSRRTNMATLPN